MDGFHVLKGRFTKYDTGTDETTAHFFNIDFIMLLGADDLKLEKL